MTLESIRSLIKPDLAAADQFIANELKSDIPLINEMVSYILQAGGKRIRPLIVILAARAFDHQEQQHIDLAAAIELIHTATLLHDDVVDNANLRRGLQTANQIWGNEASVLVGDFLYSRAFQLIVKLQNLEILNIFSYATNIIAEGEVLQLINCHNPDLSEKAYFDVIHRKTAKLFEVAAQIGTALSTYNESHMKAMQQYGLNIGIAYQLIDDVLDYQCSTAFGKNKGNDLREGKTTLPVIYALGKSNHGAAGVLRDAICNGASQKLDDVLAIIESTGAIKYTENAAKQHAKQAFSMLCHVPDSPYRQALSQLSEFVVERTY